MKGNKNTVFGGIDINEILKTYGMVCDDYPFPCVSVTIWPSPLKVCNIFDDPCMQASFKKLSLCKRQFLLLMSIANIGWKMCAVQ